MLACLIDVIPITMLTATFFYLPAGFDKNLHAYLQQQRGNPDVRMNFLQQRNEIRDLSFLICLAYCSLPEGTSLQSTIGKWLMGLTVSAIDGRKLTFGRAVGRNTAKLLSCIPPGLGFLWAVFSKRNLTWHNKMSGTCAVRGRTGS